MLGNPKCYTLSLHDATMNDKVSKLRMKISKSLNSSWKKLSGQSLSLIFLYIYLLGWLIQTDVILVKGTYAASTTVGKSEEKGTVAKSGDTEVCLAPHRR